MIQVMEITGKINEMGCIEIPAAVLDHLGLHCGDGIRLLNMTGEEKSKENREFVLIRAGGTPMETAEGEKLEFRLPSELLADAHIPADADLDVLCMDKKIVILPAEDADTQEIPQELMDIFTELGIPKEKVHVVLHAEEGTDGKADL